MRVPNLWPLQVLWWVGQTCIEHTAQDASRVLELFDQVIVSGSLPTMFQTWRQPNGPTLTIGIGRPRTVMCFEASLDPPYFVSKGDPTCAGIMEFMYGGELTEYGEENAVSFDSARPALIEFLESGERPACVDWESA